MAGAEAEVTCEYFYVSPIPGNLMCSKCGRPSSDHVKVGGKDAVNNPAHYGGADDPYEHIKVVQAWGLNYQLGNCTKYIARAGKKDPAKLLEDLQKARFYLDYEIKRLGGS